MDRSDRVALEAGDQRLTYGQLEELLDQPQPWFTWDKSLATVISWLACWRQKRPFCALAPDWPEGRRQAVLSDSKDLPDGTGYVIFTSGSTGRPKGVAVGRRGLPGMIAQQVREFGLTATSRVLWYLSPGFDASISDVFTTFAAGATLVLAPHRLPGGPLEEQIERLGITHLDLPPCLLGQFVRLPAGLETLVIGGEVCPAWAIRRWADQVRLVNVYGPTEATICTSLSVCGEDWVEGSIGRPLEGVEYRLVDGELWIGGEQVALGYLREPDLTRAKFVDGFYRTGDRVERLPDGSYRFLGRLDRQFKRQGRLVAPEEVESLVGQPVEVCQGRLVTNGPVPNLRESLPAWMIPVQRATAPVEPLARLWWELTGHSPQSGDDFFEVGGDSFLVLRLAADARKLGFDLTPESIYREPTYGGQRRRGGSVPKVTTIPTPVAPMARAWLTGASGFFGSFLARYLECDTTRCELSQPLLDVPDCDGVIHAAARTQLGPPLEELWPVNVEGTAQLLSLGKPFHYLSSLAVLAQGRRPPGRLTTEMKPEPEGLFGGYAQSKGWAELMMEGAWIYRLGLLVGPGLAGQLAGFVDGLLRWRGLPPVDREALRFDVTPVELAAQAVARLSRESQGVYHLANPVSLSLAGLIELLGIEVECRPDFFDLVEGDEFFRLAFQLPEFNLFLATDYTFETSWERCGLVCPPPAQVLREWLVYR